MKTRILLPMLFLLCASTRAFAQEEEADDFEFSEYYYSMQQIGKVWDHLNLYSLSREYPPDIKECFISFVLAYPNDAMQVILAQVLGYDQGGSLDGYVMDTTNRYMQCDMLTELTAGIQMCLWHMKDGNTMVAVALKGDEYNEEEPDEALLSSMSESERDEYIEDHITACVNNLMFYKIMKNEAIWRPRTPQKLCGRTFNFSEYDIQLPKGRDKDIRLTHNADPRKNVVLKWNDGTFIVKD